MINTLGEYVKQKRGDMSLRDFAKRCGLSHTHLDSIEKGFDPRTGKPVSPTIEVLRKIAKGTGSTLGDFLIAAGFIDNDYIRHNGDMSYLSEDDVYTLLQDEIKEALNTEDKESLKRFAALWYNHQKQINQLLKRDPVLHAAETPALYGYGTPMDNYHTYSVPVYGEVTAGPGGYALNEYLGTEQWTTSKNGSCAEYFMLQVKGDSMYPRFLPGDYAVVKPQNDVDNGDPAIVIINGEEGTLKRVKKVPNGIILRSDNSLYPDREFYNEDAAAVYIVGKVIDIKPGRL